MRLSKAVARSASPPRLKRGAQLDAARALRPQRRVAGIAVREAAEAERLERVVQVVEGRRLERACRRPPQAVQPGASANCQPALPVLRPPNCELSIVPQRRLPLRARRGRPHSRRRPSAMRAFGLA